MIHAPAGQSERDSRVKTLKREKFAVSSSSNPIPVRRRFASIVSAKSVFRLRIKRTGFFCALLILLAGHTPLFADALESGFANPPIESRLRAYWWWLNSDV